MPFTFPFPNAIKAKRGCLATISGRLTGIRSARRCFSWYRRFADSHLQYYVSLYFSFRWSIAKLTGPTPRKRVESAQPSQSTSEVDVSVAWYCVQVGSSLNGGPGTRCVQVAVGVVSGAARIS